MAREFVNVAGNTTQSGINYSGAPAVAGLGVATMVLRAGLDSDTVGDGVICEVTNANLLSIFGFTRSGSADAIALIVRNNNVQSIPSAPYTYDGVMRSIIGTWDGSQAEADKVKIYVDGASQTVSINTGIPNTVLGSGQTLCSISARTGRGGCNGRIAEVAIYNRVLTAGEIAAHAVGASCLTFPRGLIFYVPMIREVHDIARGLTGTITGTTVIPHPRVYL
jgi:hypothetical protein